MNWLRQWAAMIVLALWGVATMHCVLERLPGLEFLACCQHPGAVPHEDNDCDQDGCATVESGACVSPDTQNDVPPPPLSLASLTPVLLEPSRPLLPPSIACAGSSPPEFPSGWQFATRAAPMVRAPSWIA